MSSAFMKTEYNEYEEPKYKLYSSGDKPAVDIRSLTDEQIANIIQFLRKDWSGMENFDTGYWANDLYAGTSIDVWVWEMYLTKEQERRMFMDKYKYTEKPIKKSTVKPDGWYQV